MKTKSLLLLCMFFLSTFIYGSTTYTVTNTNVSGEGSLSQAYASAVTGDVINFNFDGTEISLAGAVVMKSITINGLNAFNGQKVILRQTTANQSFFTLASGITGTFQNLVFDGIGVLGNSAITAANGSTLNIENCVFRNINAQLNNGGGARIQGAANISGSLFENNITGGGFGGGALCIFNAANVTIDKCSFIGNISNTNGNSGGGAIVARGTVATACNVTITNSTFANNFSGRTGGAILSSVQSSSAFTANVRAINCTFTGNQGDGAINVLTTNNGFAYVYLVNSIVVNNVNAAADAYSDLLETKGTNVATVVAIEPHHVIYSVASETVVTASRNCIQVANPATANIFKTMETFATDKRRPVITTTLGHKVAEISATSIALNAGIATLAGYTIPTVDQLGFFRPATPSIGAVERDFTNMVPDMDDNDLKIYLKNKAITFSGLSGEQTLSVYALNGQLVHQSVVRNNEIVKLDHIVDNLMIVRVQNRSFKLLMK